MSARLTVIFFIVLCLEAGLALTILPWAGWWLGLGDWGDNYLLVYAAQKTGFRGLQSAVSSGWMRGAVTGLGLLNLLMAFWEMAHFRQTVRALNAHAYEPKPLADARPAADTTPRAASSDEAHAPRPDDPALLPHHGGRDDGRDDS
ncbi:MAG TPA: hypothetical protein VFX96_17375 [Pyrinomonadaceae bacterium]|nr:hypothetical protein [Pyrinomonadaceae bacterium]